MSSPATCSSSQPEPASSSSVPTRSLYFICRKEEIISLTREALPLHFHINHCKLYYARKNPSNAFDLVQINFWFFILPEEVLGTDQHQIVASACLAEGKNEKIVTLNSLREIRVYQTEQKFLTFYLNISLVNYGVPQNFPQFYFNHFDLSVIFNGRDYCAYKSKEDAEAMKPIEAEFYSATKS